MCTPEQIFVILEINEQKKKRNETCFENDNSIKHVWRHIKKAVRKKILKFPDFQLFYGNSN